jgi:transcriptional regulator with XRE-family HTH domain
MTVNEAVLALRKHANETQQRFATRLDMSISSLQNYEQDRIPEPRQLLAFLLAAEGEERDDLAEVFRLALIGRLGLPDPSTLFQTKDWFESAAVRILLLSIRKSYPSAKKLIREIAAIQEQIRHRDATAFTTEAVKRGFINPPKRRNKQRERDSK